MWRLWQWRTWLNRYRDDDMGEGANPAWMVQQEQEPQRQYRIAQGQQLQNAYSPLLQGLGQQGLTNDLGGLGYEPPPPGSMMTYFGTTMAYVPGQYAYPQQQFTIQAGPSTEAEKTAEALLLRHLNDEQKASWEKHKGFWVTAAKSGNRYWLDGGRPRSMPQDGPPQSHCINANDSEGCNLPKGDQILAQKLLIETDEEKFIATANNARL